MTDPALKTLNRLYEIAKDFEPVDEDYFELGGVMFQRALPSPREKGEWPDGYRCCPKNSTWFASTDCDGVHFRFLEIGGAVREDSPIVMTVPMNFDEPNIVVGENLLDYLSLGCRSIYDVTDIAYKNSALLSFLEDPEGGLRYYTFFEFDPEHVPTPEQKILIDEFNLKPWENVRERLKYLREKYLHLLVVEEE